MSNNFVQEFEQRVKEHPDKDALVSYDEDLNSTTLSFKQLWTLSARCAALLRENGMKRKDNVLITLPIGPEYWVVSFGAIMAGGMPVVVKTLCDDAKILKEVIKMAQCKFIVTDFNHKIHAGPIVSPYMASDDLVSSVDIPELPSVQTVVAMRRKGNGHQGFLDILESRKTEYADRDLKLSDPCISTLSMNPNKMYTPKVFEISHGATVAQSKGWGAKFPHFESVYYPYMWYAICAAPFDTLAGQTRIQPDSWENLLYFETQTKMCKAGLVKAAFMGMADAMIVFENSQECERPLIETLIVGGCLVTRNAVEKLLKLAKQVYVTYVGSEFLYCTMDEVTSHQTFKDSWSGKAMDGIKIRIVDENQKLVPAGQLGEIQLSTDRAFTKYLGEPELSAEAFTKDGWLSTKDEGYLTPDGDLYCFGRMGNVIMRDLAIIPVSIMEKPISDHPDVVEVRLVGLPDSLKGFDTCACIVKRQGSTLTSEQIRSCLEDSLSLMGRGLYALDHVVFFEDSIKARSKQDLVCTACKILGRPAQ